MDYSVTQCTVSDWLGRDEASEKKKEYRGTLSLLLPDTVVGGFAGKGV